METWRDIVAEMRDQESGEYFPFTKFEIKTTPKIRHLIQVFADRIEATCKTLEAENAKLRRAMKPVMMCDCNPSTPTPWFVSDGEIKGKAEYSTQFPDEDGEMIFEYCDTETVCQCFYNERCGVNPANKCSWIDDENSKPMAESNERAIVSAVNAVREAQAIMKGKE